MEAIVLAGGLGTRLAAKLSGIPKPMAPVAGRPFLEILLTQLKRNGCTRVVLSVGHLYRVIQDYFGKSFHGMHIDYSIESVPLGTGGAIRRSLAQAEEDAVLVLNGDTFLEADYKAMVQFHVAEAAVLTIAIAMVECSSRESALWVSRRRAAPVPAGSTQACMLSIRICHGHKRCQRSFPSRWIS
jgi:D-glycero-alpha-D-manno-heptose 1-phosphate guanylyltransferase